MKLVFGMRPMILRDTAEAGGGGVASVPERPTHVSEDEWEGLSDFEREALVETDEGEGAHQVLGDGTEYEEESMDFDEDTLAAIAGEEPKPAEVEEDSAPEVEPVAEAAAEVESAPIETGTLPTDDELLSFRPRISDSEIPLSDEVPAEIQAKFDALEQQFTDGDIEASAYRAETNKLNREVMHYQIQQRDIAKDDLTWQKEQAAFVAARPDYRELEADGKTFSIRADAMFGALSKQVERLNSIPANAAKSGMQILLEADKLVRQAFGLPLPGATAKPAVATAPAATKPAAAETKPAAATRTVQTLSNVPVAEAEQVGNPFSAITRLSGEKFEKALEQMSPAQREAMLARM